MPGCPHTIGITYDVFVASDLRGKGIGKKQHLARLKKAAEMGFSYLFCSVNSENSAEKHILAANGWSLKDSFRPLHYGKGNSTYVEIWGRRMEPQTHIAAPHLSR